MATRFYLGNTIVSPISPAFDAGWEVTTATTRRLLIRKTTADVLRTSANVTVTIPITTTQDIHGYQVTSEPIPPQRITGTVSAVMAVFEDALTANATLAMVVKVVSNDGGTARGTLFSVFGTDTEFAAAAYSTRIVNAQAVTELTTQPGDRIVVELGVHATGPTAAGNFQLRTGYGATDYALTSGLTTSLNPWIEFSQNIWSADTNNYQFVRVGDGMSTGEKIR